MELSLAPDCPHATAARAVLRTALDDIGLADMDFAVTVFDAAHDAGTSRFAGSPTLCVDGIDLFPHPDLGAAPTCRLYPTADGLRGVPDLRDLRQALKRAAEPLASRTAQG